MEWPKSIFRNSDRRFDLLIIFIFASERLVTRQFRNLSSYTVLTGIAISFRPLFVSLSLI
jgi:hypothetical protein